MMKRKYCFCLAVCAILLFPALSFADAKDELKFGTQPYFSNAPIFVMIEGGYFEKAGVNVKTTVSLATGTEMLAALVSGQYDVVGGGLGAGTFNAALRGMNIRVIADKGSNRGKQSYGWILVRKDLFDSKKITRVEDLKGKKIGEPGVGSASWIELGMILAKRGMSFDHMTLVKLREPDTVAALRAGTIDAAMVSEPSIARAKALGVAVELASVGEELGEHQEAVLITTADAIKNKEPLLRKFLKAYVQGVKDYFGDPKKKQYLEAIAKYTKTDMATLAACYPPYIAPDATLAKKSMQRQLEWLVKQGSVKEVFPMEKLVDESLLPK